MKRLIGAAAALATVGLATLAFAGTAATPATSSPAPATVALYGGGGPVSAPGLELTLRRVTLPPGTIIPPHTHPGAFVLHVESGMFGFTPLAGKDRVTRAAAAGASPAPPEDLVDRRRGGPQRR